MRNPTYTLLFFSFFLFSLYSSFCHASSNAFTNNTTGTIVETMDASGYTYMLIDSDKEKTWVAIPKTQVKQGAKVTYESGMVMKNFASKSLDRTFETIIFSSGLIGEKKSDFHGAKTDDSFSNAVKTEQTKVAVPTPSMQASGGSSVAITPLQEVTVTKSDAANGYSVEEIFSQAQELNGQKVVVRGIVVKVSANIMGRNWVHLQDGTGNPMKNTHDIVATTSEHPELNSEVTIEGVVAAEKDFGAGYKYAAIIEQAKILQ